MKTNNEKFKEDLEIGQMGERIIAKFLEDDYKYTMINFGNDYEYDVKMKCDGREVLIEVKTDRWEHYKNKITNNIFIEVSCNGKLSGIHSTKSDLFVYFFPDQEKAYFILTKDLRILIKTPGLCVQTATGSDGARVRGIIITKIEFEKWFKILKVEKSPIWK
jgi:hypothetical protein